jgi:uncharacterized protein YcnI
MAALGIGVVAALAWAGIAFAHVEVEADPDVAGSTNAVVTFTAEAESSVAGITSVRILLPTGIAPGDVSLKAAPAGWTLSPETDGYTVAGKALPKGTDVVHSIVVARLPNATQLVFKALVTYSDKTVDRWIEEKSASNPNPDHPAPVLALKPGSDTLPTPTATATPGPVVNAAATQPTPAAAPSTSGGGTGWIWWVVGVVVVVSGVAAYALSRRRASN